MHPRSKNRPSVLYLVNKCFHFEVSVVNVPYVFFIAVSFTHEKLVRPLSKGASIWTSCIIVAKLLFQMKFVKESDVLVNCSVGSLIAF